MASSFLGGSAAVRSSNKWLSQINMVTIVLGLVLSVMVINTHNSCSEPNFKDNTDKMVYFQYVVAILVLVFFIILFLFDMGVMFKLF
jgi:ABC-type polysaccharide transport system permease subunit